MGRQSNKENISTNQVARPPRKDKKRKVSSAKEILSSSGCKKVKQEGPALSPPPLSLMTLPSDVHYLLLQYLDVSSMRRLALTCSHFDSLIKGRYLTSVSLPMLSTDSFMKEVKKAQTIEKKPLLRILRRKPVSMKSRYYAWSYETNPKVVDFQICLLNLEKVQEVEFGPKKKVREVTETTARAWADLVEVDKFIFTKLSALGALRNISRLDVTIPEENYAKYLWKEIIPEVKLLKLRLTVVERSGICLPCVYTYLEEIVSICRADKVSVTALTTGKRVKKIPKLFRNDLIEELQVSAPCGFDLQLQMKKLKKVTLRLPVDVCSYPRSRISDRQLHRNGLCVVHLGSLHGSCPQLTVFNGLQLGSMATSFSQWNSKISKIFYDQYILLGGEMEFKTWAKRRWFQKKPAA